jgi:hypothetical protein
MLGMAGLAFARRYAQSRSPSIQCRPRSIAVSDKKMKLLFAALAFSLATIQPSMAAAG